MTSAINPTIDVNYPTAGVNNSSQGFRTNFASINTSLQTAATEITELQNKALLKSAITGTVLDNDMANGLIKNAQTLGFRASTYTLGNNLTGTVNIDLTLGDVQYGGMVGNISLTFSKWAPTGTGSSVEVILTVTPGQTITLPVSVSLGASTIEGYSSNVITVSSDVTRLHYRFNTIDCGTTIEIVPVDRPRQATQVESVASLPSIGLMAGDFRFLSTTGNFKGYNGASWVQMTEMVSAPTHSTSSGKPGQIAYDSTYLYVCVGTNTWSRVTLSVTPW